VQTKPKVIDLFSGVGGLSLGFEMSGFDVVLANEYDPSIAEAYTRNRHKSNMIVADITKLPIKKTFEPYFGDISVIIGGPPCQGFSQKGQRKSINDERNFLFRYFFQVVSLVEPEYFLMENVPNLLTTGKGCFQKEIEKLFANVGYAVRAKVLNASGFGVPQNRKRAFILGKKGKTKLALPEPSNNLVTIWDAISDLAFLESGEGMEEQAYRNSPKSEYQKRLRGTQDILYNHVSTKHTPIAMERMEMIPPGRGKESLPKEHHTKSIYSGTWSRMVQEEISVTITTRFDTPSSGKFTHPYLHRAITVREAARIQSFPDSFRFYGNKGSQMKQVGNAVPPLLAQAVADVIYSDIQNK
jgi:DNA (cytosine-5)-methyltransferase 1